MKQIEGILIYEYIKSIKTIKVCLCRSSNKRKGLSGMDRVIDSGSYHGLRIEAVTVERVTGHSEVLTCCSSPFVGYFWTFVFG